MAADVDIPGGLLEAALAAQAAPAGADPPRAVDVLLDAFVLRLTAGYAAAAPTLTRALEMLRALNVGPDEPGRWLWLAGGRVSVLVAVELWDPEAWHAFAARQAQFARDTGALLHLQLALSFLARSRLLAGELATAAVMIEEERLIAEATGNPPLRNARMTLAAWRGREAEASELIEASLDEATAHGWTPERLRELGALQRPRSPPRRARHRLAGVRTRSDRLGALSRNRAGRGSVANR